MRLFVILLLLVSVTVCIPACGNSRMQRQPSTQRPSRSQAQFIIPQFSDQTARAGLRFRHDNGSSGRFYYPEIVGPGCGLFDYDNDGDLDVYLVQSAPFPGWKGNEKSLSNKLYRNNHDGTFTDVTAKAGVSGIVNGKKTYGVGCAVGDYDNDGDLDLLVTNYGRCILYRNNGNGTFSDVTASTGIKGEGFWSSAAFFDYNKDGRLELFICQYIKYKVGDDVACGATYKQPDYCPPGFFPPTQSVLYRNNGNGTFADVSKAAGIVSEYNKALGAVTADFNGDGWEDIYVTCDLTPNLLYVNQGNGTFKEEAIDQGVALNELGQPQASMGVDARDYDGDLKPDIIVTNYWLEGANVFHNLGKEMFADLNQQTSIGPATLKKVGWGTSFRDFNNDGLLDCFMANGHVLLFPDQSTPGAEVKQADLLFLNIGGGKFRNVSDQAGSWFKTKRVARGAAFGDVDNDGDIDVLIAHNNDAPALLVNDGGNKNNWLQVKLTGKKGNRDGIGAKVFVTVGGKTVYDQVHSTYSFASANDLRVHFGLGNAEFVDALRVEWASGQKDVFQRVKANQIFPVTEGQTEK